MSDERKILEQAVPGPDGNFRFPRFDESAEEKVKSELDRAEVLVQEK